MGFLPVNKVFCSFLLLVAAACILQSAMAENGTISIAYRGLGEGYIGDTIVFDGYNTFGNTTLIKITGPGLPAEGVPADNLDGPSGTATPVEGDRYGMWKFVWDSSGVPGLDKLTTGVYTFSATDLSNPNQSATSRVTLNKPVYSISASPNPVYPGQYIELTGYAEQGLSSAKIDITDSSGRVLHSFTTPVSSSGYFSYGFHGNMDPGQYPVTVSNPALKAPFGTVISVIPERGTLPVSTVTTAEQISSVPATDVTAAMTTVPVPDSTPTPSPVSPVTVLAALITGVVICGIFRR